MNSWAGTVRSLLLWGPLAILLAVVGALIAPIAADQLDTTRHAEATIGLTQDSEWPFHDSWLALTVGTLDDGSILAEGQAALGLSDSNSEIDVTGNSNGTRSTLTIEATAPTGEEAADLANFVAESMVIATPAEAPVTVLDRADIPAEPSRTNAAVAGGLIGLLVGLALIPFLDRSFGRVRTTHHYEFVGLVDRWIEPGMGGGVLPVANPDHELVAALRNDPGPIVVLAAGASEAATGVAKTLATDLPVEVIDGGSVDSASAAPEVVDAGSIVVVVAKGKVSRRYLCKVILRLEQLGCATPTVALLKSSAARSVS